MSSPILIIAPQPHGQARFAGSITCLSHGSSCGSRPRWRGCAGRSRLRLFDFGQGGLEVLEGQLPGIGTELLGSLAVKCLAELPDQMLEALVLLGERPDLGFEPCPRHPLGTQRRLLRRESRLVGGR